MPGFVRKAFHRAWLALALFAAIPPLLALLAGIPSKTSAGVPIELLLPTAAIVLGAKVVSDELHGGAVEFVLSLPLSGTGLLARVFVAGILPLAAVALILSWELDGGPVARHFRPDAWPPYVILFLWPYTAGFLAALLVDRFPASVALGFVLFLLPEVTVGMEQRALPWRWLAFTLYALFVAQRLFAPPGYLEPSMRAARAADGLLGFGILALAFGRPFLFV